MKKNNLLISLILFVIINISIAAQPSDLFFTEYIEGSSNNKALEIYNGTGSAIDLSAGTYIIEFYSNGSTTANTTISLSGIVNINDVYVVADDDASATILAVTDQTNTSSFYNGDDAIVLKKGATILDVIGQIGVDPGTEWGSGLTSTADNTLRRKAGTTAGDTNKDDAFDPSIEWDGYATDTFDGLGSPAPVPVELSSFTASVNGKEINLKWTTKTEVNNYGFEIERSLTPAPSQREGNFSWERIGFVSGAGNSNSPKYYNFTDNKTYGYGKYSYRLKQLDNDGRFEYSSVVEVDLGAVKEYVLNQNYPNPFNPATVIKYAIPKAGNVKLSVYNILGSEIAILVDEYQEAGAFTKEFSVDNIGLKLTNGVYFYKLETGNFIDTKKFILMK